MRGFAQGLARDLEAPRMELITGPALDGWLADLKRVHPSWLSMSLEKRLGYLRRLRDDVHRLADRWAEVCCHIKGLNPKMAAWGEEWTLGPWIVLRNLRLLENFIQTAQPAGGRIVKSLPGDSWDLLLWGVLRGETWCGNFPETSPNPGVSLVLGAGNVSSISATDILYKMFIENHVVLLKMNPIHEALGEVLEEAFACLIADGYMRIVRGGAQEGALACSHTEVDNLHITGSSHTYKAVAQSVNNKPITAELGCVSPMIVAPGKWSRRALEYHARQVAQALTANAGFNCNAVQVLITSRKWPQRQAFLDEVRRALSKVPARPAYYPGAMQRYQEILQEYPAAERLGPPAEGSITWTLVTDLDPDKDHWAFRQEAFCGVLFETSLDVLDSEFLHHACEFANQRLWGNLSCSLLISPDAQRTLPWRRAIEDLRYGAIGVNLWAGLAFPLVNLPWGAYPGNDGDDIQSGVGIVHNTAGVSGVEKCVLYGPFTLPLHMPWQSGYRRTLQLSKALIDFEHRPGRRSLLNCYWQLLRGGFGM